MLIDSAAKDFGIDPELIARFRADCEPYCGHKSAFLVALSGGPDSIALLLLAKLAGIGAVHAATVDHGLRAASAEEARFCAEICARLDVPHHILTVAIDPGNIQSQARAARYRALGDWMEEIGAKVLMTAHHADDQAETLLMRLNRASGVSGLAGIQRVGPMPKSGGTVFRPLLQWRKAELEQIVTDAGIEAVRDPTNEDDRFDRARMRKALGDADWLDPLRLARSVSHLQDADAALEEWAQREWTLHVSESEGKIVYRSLNSDPSELTARVIAMAMERLIGQSSRSGAMQLVSALKAGQTSNVGGVIARSGDHGSASCPEKRQEWELRREPPRNLPKARQPLQD